MQSSQPPRLQIAPSILAADFARLGAEIAAVAAAGADLIHVDVMDGHFVPNLTIGPPVVKALKQVSPLPLDVHLMVRDAEGWIDRWIDAGADWISVHVEAAPHLCRTLSAIAEAGRAPGAVLNPHTPETALEYVLDQLHHVLIMSVNPGFGGQAFMPSVLPKIERLRKMADGRGLDLRIEVDGGVDEITARRVRDAGADVLVAGSAIFKRSDYAAAIAALRA